MPATGDRITKRKDGLFQGMYTAQTPDGPKRKYIYGRKKKDVLRAKVARSRQRAANPGPLQPLDAKHGPQHRRRDRRSTWRVNYDAVSPTVVKVLRASLEGEPFKTAHLR